MQVITDGTGTYRSLSKACQSVLRKEGITGFYQGMAPALFAASGSWGGYFYFYESSKKRKRTGQQTDAPLGTFDHVSRYIISFDHLVLVCFNFYCTVSIRRRGWSYSGTAVQSNVGRQDKASGTGR